MRPLIFAERANGWRVVNRQIARNVVEAPPQVIQKGEEMLSIKNLVSLSALAFVCALAGCDQSKAELDATKTQLQTVSAERDGLKTQLAATSQQIAGLRQQVADLQAKLAQAAAPAPAPEPAAEPKKDEPKGKKGGKKVAKEEPAAAPAAPAKPAPTTGPATEARKGRGHF
jgi:septal ring factor EnvC (AmiA/AmiB activator)